jgi:hypothetical protein
MHDTSYQKRSWQCWHLLNEAEMYPTVLSQTHKAQLQFQMHFADTNPALSKLQFRYLNNSILQQKRTSNIERTIQFHSSSFEVIID